MAQLFIRKMLINSQIRGFHKHVVLFTTPTINRSIEKTAFQDVLPDVVKSLVTGSHLSKLPEVEGWVKKLLDYTLSGGKQERGLSVPIAYRMLEEPGNYSEDVMHSTRVLGWCLEMVQAYLLVLDDVIDGSTTRRGKLCWYRQPDVGLSAINDSILLYQSMLKVLDIHFGKTPHYSEIMKLLTESILNTSIGEYLDCSSAYNKEKKNIDSFTLERFNNIAIYKTSYYSFKLPLFLALLFVKNGNEKATEELNDICLELGRLLQFQDDYMDVYGDETVTGKAGTDIQEGKCSWLAVTALQRCNQTQRSIFKEYYGSKNQVHVQHIKRLYDDLELPSLYEIYERTVYEDLVSRIHALPSEGERNYFTNLLKAAYKRIV